MSKAAVQGSFADFKVVKTRSTVQIVIEIPIEQADTALAILGGIPQPGTERPVAVARLVQQAEQPVQPASAQRRIDGKERYANADEMSKARTRAVLLCKDPLFQRHLGVGNEEHAARSLCAIMRVASRREIESSKEAYHSFLWIEKDFRAERQVAGHSEHLTGARS